MTKIENAAFESCSQKCKLIISSSVESIKGVKFCQIRSFPKILLQSPIITIGNNVFSNCSALT